MLRNSLRFFLILTLSLTILLVSITAPVFSKPPTSVSLIDFRAENGEGGVRLAWETATELNTAGFRVHRGPTENGPFEALSDIGLISATGGPTSGSSYEALDTTVVSGQTYWYRLIEIEFNSSEHLLDTVSITAGGEPTPTVEAVPTVGDNPTDEPPGTTGSSATNTPGPSPTGTPQTAASTAASTTATPTTVAQSSPAPSAPTANATQLRPVGGVTEAAESIAGSQPTALAQVTSAYPEPQPLETTPAGGYPPENEGDDEPELSTTTAVTATESSYPAGVPDPVTAPPPTTGFEGTVGSLANAGQEAAPAAQEASNLSRVLLWIGFVAALLIFGAGAFSSILLSTRRQRRELP